MKRNIKNGQGFIYSIFNGNKLNQKDIQHILNYANALKNGSKPSEAYRDNLQGCKSTDKLVNGLKNVPKTSKAATFGSKAEILN
jgi:hypothetical protein